MSILHKLAPPVAASVLLIGVIAGATATHASRQVATGPQPGVCKGTAGQWTFPQGAPLNSTGRPSS
jgi:hypothetical protein